jgi:hypothetical protein
MSNDSPPPAGSASLLGEVVYFYAFDFAYDMQPQPVTSLLGHRLEPWQIDPRKRSPRGQNFFRPLMATLPPLEREVAGRKIRLQVSIKLLPIGALSLTLRTDFQVSEISALARWHDLVFDDGQTLDQWVKHTAELARKELAGHAIRPHDRLPEGEFYTAFCLQADSPGITTAAADWLEQHRAAVAALLTNEGGREHLSVQEIEGSTSHSLSYYRHDLVVVDWDCALVIDRPADFDEALYIMELANVQLEELEAYDVFIDEALERAYRDLSGHQRRHPGSGKGSVLRELKELRMDLARFSDGLQNITKFFGEWHLARVYEHTARVFHLADWHRAIDEKLKTLDSLYEMLKQDQNHRIMLWLEAAIVLLFILDLVMIFEGIGK